MCYTVRHILINDIQKFENLKLDVGGKMLNDWVIKYRKDFDRKR